MALCDRYCERCYYHRTGVCDYFLETKRRRGCPAGEGCVMRITRPKGAPLLNDALVWRLYEKERLSDREIGERLGTTHQRIFYWRKAFGYPPNKKGGAQAEREPAARPEDIMRRQENGYVEN